MSFNPVNPTPKQLNKAFFMVKGPLVGGPFPSICQFSGLQGK